MTKKMTITLEESLIDSIKSELNCPNLNNAIIKLYQFYINSKDNDLDIEGINKDDTEYQTIIDGIDEYKKYPENFGTMEDIKWD